MTISLDITSVSKFFIFKFNINVLILSDISAYSCVNLEILQAIIPPEFYFFMEKYYSALRSFGLEVTDFCVLVVPVIGLDIFDEIF